MRRQREGELDLLTPGILAYDSPLVHLEIQGRVRVGSVLGLPHHICLSNYLSRNWKLLADLWIRSPPTSRGG